MNEPFTKRPAGSADRDDDFLFIDVAGWARAALRHWMVIAALFVMGIALSSLYAATRTPVYTANTDVLIDPREAQIVDIEAVLSGANVNTAVVTAVEIMKSRKIAKMVIDDLSLVNDSEFNPAVGEGAPLSGEDLTRIYTAFANRLSVKRRDETDIVRIEFESVDPQKAALIADAVANSYIRSEVDGQRQIRLEANSWLETRLASLQNQLLAAEQDVEAFRESRDVFISEGATPSEQSALELNRRLAVLQAERASQEARLSVLQSRWRTGGDLAAVEEALQSDVIRDLRVRKAQLESSVAELATRYGRRHPSLIAAADELSDMNAQIDAEVNRIIDTLVTQVAVARESEAALQRRFDSIRLSTFDDRQDLVRFRDLERRAQSIRILYEEFLARTQETSEQIQFVRANASILAPAATPTVPTSASKKTVFATGLFVSAIVAFAVGLTLEFFQGGFSSRDDFERTLGIRHLASIPQIRKRARPRRMSRVWKRQVGEARGVSAGEYLALNPSSLFAQAMMRIQMRLLSNTNNSAPRTIALFSSQANEGKTTTAICLARSFALAGKKTIVVDCDFRNPCIGEHFKVAPRYGLDDLLQNGDLDLAKCIVYGDRSDDFDVLPIREAYADMSIPKILMPLRNILEKLKHYYDIIILDTAPLLAVADSALLTQICDASIFLVRWHETQKSAAKTALAELSELNGNVVGGVLAQVDLKSARFYSSYEHYGYMPRYGKTPYRKRSPRISVVK